MADRFGFVLFAFGGSILILAAKHFSLHAGYVAVGAVALLFLYAALVHWRGTGRLRSDQAGDNCYYLGLIYTLASLSYAIIVFDPANTATTIVQGFGIALATTVTGLILRVFFNQSRVDLYEVEDTARLELAEAAGNLKTILSQLAVGFNDFAQQTQQVISEVRDSAASDIRSMAETSAETMKTFTAASSELLGSSSKELTTATRKLTSTTEKLTTAVEVHTGAMSHASNFIGLAEKTAESVQRSNERLAESAELVSAQALSTAALQESSKQAMDSLLAAVAALTSGIQESAASSLAVQEQFKAKLEQVQNLPVILSQEASASISASAQGLAADIAALGAVHQRLSVDIATGADALLAAVASHNDALEDELRRSRDNVSKVHSSLVDMTSELVGRLT